MVNNMMTKGVYKQTEEHKKKISDAMKGRAKSEEHRKNLSIAQKKAQGTPEARKKQSDIQKKRLQAIKKEK